MRGRRLERCGIRAVRCSWYFGDEIQGCPKRWRSQDALVIIECPRRLDLSERSSFQLTNPGQPRFLVGRMASLASVRGPMTRFLALSIAVLALAFSACEKHPLPGQTAVTTVPGIDGFGAGHGS